MGGILPCKVEMCKIRTVKWMTPLPILIYSSVISHTLFQFADYSLYHKKYISSIIIFLQKTSEMKNSSVKVILLDLYS